MNESLRQGPGSGLQTLSGTPEQFAAQGYVVLKSLLTDPRLSQLRRYAHQRARSGTLTGDAQVPGTPAAYGDLWMDWLLADLLPVVEAASGVALYPTYSYYRVYKRGDVLDRHTDRPACEISVTLSLGQVSGAPWPIGIEGLKGTALVELEPGSGLLYRGTECPHWREAFDGDGAAQVFLHYVERNGPHSAWRFDKREGLTSFKGR